MSNDQMVSILNALGHELRLSLWRMLLPLGPIGLPAGIIALKMSVPASTMSFHLRHMTLAGVLVQRRTSRQIIYAVNQDINDRLLAFLSASIVSPNRLPGADSTTWPKADDFRPALAQAMHSEAPKAFAADESQPKTMATCA